MFQTILLTLSNGWLKDDNDIRQLCNLMVTKLIVIDPDETARRLDAIAEAYRGVLSTKLKENSVKQDVEKQEEANKSILRVTLLLGEKMKAFVVGEWTTVHILTFMQGPVTEAAIATLTGTRILEREPDFVQAMWAYDSVIIDLLYAIRWYCARGSIVCSVSYTCSHSRLF